MDLPFINDETYVGHSGVDFPQAAGTTILASGPGRISYVGWLNDNAGYSVIVDYDNGPAVLYCHQLKDCWRPAVGSRVDYGWTLGSVGTTGRSTGNHLHMEIMRGNGAHTYAGIWNYFQRGTVVSNNKPAAVAESNTEIGDSEMIIIVIGKAWFLCLPTGGGLRAYPQPGNPDIYDDNKANKNIPVKNFTDADKNTLARLKADIPGLF